MTHEDDKLADLTSRVVRMIRERTGLHEQFALPIAAEIIDVMRHSFTGERVYFRAPRSTDEQILADFTGNNVDDVCGRHSISRATFYRILERAKRKR